MVGVFLLMTHGSSIVLFFVGFVFENPFDFDLRLCINKGGGMVLLIGKVKGKGMAM